MIDAEPGDERHASVIRGRIRPLLWQIRMGSGAPMTFAGGLSLAELVSAVRAEHSTVQLDNAIRRAGAESVVLETDTWIFRFPRPHVDFDRETALLAALDHRLPVGIPRVEWASQRRRCYAYRKLTGWRFDRSSYLSASRAEQRALADSLAELLVAIHDALSDAEIAELCVPEFFRLSARADLIDLTDVPHEVRNDIQDLLSRAHRVATTVDVDGQKVLLHNDFSSDNMVFDGVAGRVTALWDFSGVSRGSACFDFRYLLREPPLLSADVVGEYELLSGHAINWEATECAARIGDLLPLIRRGSTVEVVQLVMSWS